MAEFQEVMNQRKRMCKSQDTCSKCPLGADNRNGGICKMLMPLDLTDEDVLDGEAIIMKWAEEHPEKSSESEYKRGYIDGLKKALDIARNIKL